MPIDYQPNFQHQEWVDNQDRVMAGGANGFNVRFNAIEAEFQTLSQLFVQVSDALAALGQAPTPTVVTFTPALVGGGSFPWRFGAGAMDKPAGAQTAWGYMSVHLIDGVTLQSFRVTGLNSGQGNLQIALERGSAVNVGPFQPIVKLDVVAVGGTINQTGDAASSLATVNNESFKYLITANLQGAQGTDLVVLNAFQISFLKA